jgi:imidazoleglycerol-phosphate dehydratase
MTRKTYETEITAELSLTGGEIVIDTGVKFFDHMLTAMAFHAGWGLTVKAEGDLEVDAHHTVEDVGIVLGQILVEALPENRARFGHAYVPMDEALAFTAADAGGRAFLRYDAPIPDMPGIYDTVLTKEFFRALCRNAQLTLHLRVEGDNAHHMTEALFKSTGAALRQACAPRTGVGVASTKGVL